jgi:hypothetical protein
MKGFWRIVESVTAVILLMTFLFVASTPYLANKNIDYVNNLGYEKLKEITKDKELCYYAVTGNITALNEKINIPGYKHSIVICYPNETCIGNYTKAENVILTSYVIAGCEGYDPLEIKLYMW